MKVTIKDKILASHYWVSGEPFTIQDMRLALSTSAASVAAGLRSLDDWVSKHTEHTQNGSRTVYQRKSASSEWIRKPWVSGELTYRGCGPLEWAR